MSDVRLIERWLPIHELGIESLRERTPMTPFPAPNRLHVWWARRPLVASRAAILASLLPADADRSKFMHVLGIHGDPVASRRRIDAAKRKGERFEGEAYSYPRAFTHVPTDADRQFISSYMNGNVNPPKVLDPTAGGGSIPFETVRLGLSSLANDLNPVAALIERATIEYPARLGVGLKVEFERLAKKFVERREALLSPYFPSEPDANAIPTNFLWARTIRCPHCEGLVPLAPNWRLSPNGIGIRVVPRPGKGLGSDGRRCEFDIVSRVSDQSEGTVSDGDAICPFSDCKRVISGEEIKQQAQAGKMGEQLFCVVYKRRVETRTKSGKRGKDKWVRGYRAPRPEDDVSEPVRAKLEEKFPEWEALDSLPNEKYPEITNDERPIQYGMPLWRDMFSSRQLLGHATAVELFRGLVEEEERKGLSEIARAAFVYLALTIDKMLNYNSRMSVWMPTREVVANTFNRHDFAFCWSHAELSPLIQGVGKDWAVAQTAKCIEELTTLIESSESKHGGLFAPPGSRSNTEITISCKSGDELDHIADKSVNVVVMDPPYYDNVMYAELSDFFYVWLKRTAGLVVPELFTRRLTDKGSEAVANPAKFSGQSGAKVRAGRDYRERMQRIFEECHRVLKPDGIMTLMFTHKASGAWDALAKGLIEANFTITASWPINTEAEGSLHIKEKAAANSTIFLVCRPHAKKAAEDTSYWEDVEPMVAKAVRARVEEFQKVGIGGVDLYLASFGPALEEFSKHWPLKRGTPRSQPESRRSRAQAELFKEEFDEFAVSPEDALEAARREVKTWRLNKLTHLSGHADLDPVTSWFVLAWDAFKAPVFAYDEGLRLARAVGVDLDRDIVGRLCEKKGSDLKLWDSAARSAKGSLGSPDGSRAMIDAIHHAAHQARTRTIDGARDLLKDQHLLDEPAFLTALEAVLEVLPPSKTFTGVDPGSKDAEAAAGDFDGLEKLRRLALSDKIDKPESLKQLELELEGARP